MRRYLSVIAVFMCTVLVFSACNKMPDHARYIPKDALAVVGVNFKALGKKVAWNVITGSKLFKQMQERMPDKNSQDAMSGLENAGLDVMNTFYIYVKGNKQSNNKAVAIIPLSNEGQWEAYVKKSFPQATVKQQGDIKEVNLTQGMYAGWKDKILIIMNGLPSDYRQASYGGDAAANTGNGDMAAELENAFKTAGDNAITSNKRFTALQENGHDVTLWMNYEQMMTDYGNNGLSGLTGGVALNANLWKDAAFTGGFDFDKGAINGDMHYYVPDAIKDASKEIVDANASKEMIDLLPGKNMDMAAVWHASPKGIKDMLDKFGIGGFANVALSQKGLNMDDVLGAFSGDMAFVINDLTMEQQVSMMDSLMGNHETHYTPRFSGMFVMKINKKENFNKLIQLINPDNGLIKVGNNAFVFPISLKDSIYLMYNDKYAVIGNRYGNVSGFLNGGFKDQKMPAAASAIIYGHPAAMYFDAQQMLTAVGAGMTSHRDSAAMAATKELLLDASFSGGEFKDGSFDYKSKINFVNKDENSLLVLMDYAMKVSDANNTANPQ